MKGGADIGGAPCRVVDLVELVIAGGALEERLGEAIVGAGVKPAADVAAEGAAGSADAGIDDGENDGAGGNRGEGGMEHESASVDVMRRDAVGDIEDRRGGIGGEEDRLEGADIPVGEAEIGEQENGAGGHAELRSGSAGAGSRAAGLISCSRRRRIGTPRAARSRATARGSSARPSRGKRT